MTLSGRQLALFVLLAVVAQLLGCGKRGPPQAPFVRVPAPVGDLRVHRMGNDVHIGFTLPIQNVDGSTPADLERIEIYAMTIQPRLPPDRELDLEEFMEEGTLVGTIEALPAELAQAAAALAAEEAELVGPPRPVELDPRPAQGFPASLVETLTPDTLVPIDPWEDEREETKKKKKRKLKRPIRQPLMTPQLPGVLQRQYAVVGISSRGEEGEAATREVVPLVDPPFAPPSPVVTYDEEVVEVVWQLPVGVRGTVQEPVRPPTEDEDDEDEEDGTTPTTLAPGAVAPTGAVPPIGTGPVAPTGTVGPTGIIAPTGVVVPATPTGAVAPAAPTGVTPATPTGVVTPAAPTGVTPAASTGPLTPTGAVAPTGPVAVGTPAGGVTTPGTVAPGLPTTAPGQPGVPGPTGPTGVVPGALGGPVLPRLESTPIVEWPPATRYDLFEVVEPGPGPPTMPLPLNLIPLEEPTYEDERVEFGVERCYGVLSLDEVDELEIRSVVSDPTCVTFVDTFPPEQPEGLTAVGSEGTVSLIWNPNEEEDLAGYLVLRGLPPGETLRPLTLEPVIENTFRDITGEPGVDYVYVVIAVDTATPPNQSLPSEQVQERPR